MVARPPMNEYELEEIKFGPITTTPPADALRGTPETAWDQQQRKYQWMVRENLRAVP